jgi:hypothetical protein
MVKKIKETQCIDISDGKIDSKSTSSVVKIKKERKSKKNSLIESCSSSEQIDIDKIEKVFENIEEKVFENIEEKVFENENYIDNDGEEQEEQEKEEKIITKKRGRKPKGGKIVLQMLSNLSVSESKPNIILHLKCSLKDLQNDFFSNNSLESFHFSSGKNDLNYEIIKNENEILTNTHYAINEKENLEIDNDNDTIDNNTVVSNSNNDLKLIWKKLKQLEYSLHINNISDKKSACFWCTYDFDNPPVYIPKHFIKDSYHVYGCFCSPECATAYLMEENIDSSAKFERYQLLNHIYSKIYQYNKNIKPSPNPYYMLEKYYGNLSIQEYRSLLKNERLFLIVDKPLTRILPELHEDNDDFIINNKIIPSSNIPLKGKLRKKIQSKTNIINEKFGLS